MSESMTEPTSKPLPRVVETTHSEQIRADRACIGCGFNLFGQPVFKEEHYNMSVARCPECGQVAALQTYPTMSHWVNRFRAILASIWILFLMGAMFGSVMYQVGMSIASVEIASESFSRTIAGAYEQYEAAKQIESTGVSGVVSNTPNSTTTVTGATTVTVTTPFPQAFAGSRWVQLDNDWIEDEFPQVREDLGGLWENIDREFMVMIIPAIVASLAVGIFWSVALLAASRPRAFVAPLIASLIACSLVIGFNTVNGSYITASSFTKTLYTPYIVPMMVLLMLSVMGFGVFIGRMVMRKVVLLALPARSRVSFSVLWTRDGLELPKP
jgi:hypothetical protein